MVLIFFDCQLINLNFALQNAESIQQAGKRAASESSHAQLVIPRPMQETLQMSEVRRRVDVARTAKWEGSDELLQQFQRSSIGFEDGFTLEPYNGCIASDREKISKSMPMSSTMLRGVLEKAISLGLDASSLLQKNKKYYNRQKVAKGEAYVLGFVKSGHKIPKVPEYFHAAAGQFIKNHDAFGYFVALTELAQMREKELPKANETLGEKLMATLSGSFSRLLGKLQTANEP